MKLKTVELEFYAFYWDWNSQELNRTNVLSSELKEEIYKKIKNGKIQNRQDLYNCVDSYLMWRYWCKAEYEVMIGDLFEKDFSKYQKVDIYYQLKPNINIIVDYIINKMEIKFSEGK